MSSNRQTQIESIADAVEYAEAVLRRHPERDAFESYLAALEGRRRPHSGLILMHLAVPNDPGPELDELELPEVVMPDSPEGNLAREIIRMLTPLDMLNPVALRFGLGRGSESMVPSFGIPLNPEAQNAPVFHRSLAQVLSEPPPQVETSGLFPEMRARIDLIKAHVPTSFKIEFPGVQGPFNIAHAIFSDEVFTAPYDDPAGFHAAMERITLSVERVVQLQ